MIPMSLNIYIYIWLFLLHAACHSPPSIIPWLNNATVRPPPTVPPLSLKASLAFRATEGNYLGGKLTCIVCQ